jgi:CRISPR-associated protein Csb2
MLVIELSFPAGRYHATAWGRHVNEGVPEWPPSPYRLIRALFDSWKRKLPAWEQGRVQNLLAKLASAPPWFVLPKASEAHTRSFLSRNEPDPTEKTLVFDAFISVAPRDTVLMGWPEAGLSASEEDDLDELLCLLNYLGRSESWISARVLRGITGARWNCMPANQESVSRDFEIVRVAVARPPEHLPGKNWMDELAFSTGDLLKSRRSDPPALEFVDYLRPPRCLGIEPGLRVARSAGSVQGVLYALDSKVLPVVTHTLEISEQVRVRLMGIHKKIAGGAEFVSPRFSGKDNDGEPLRGHKHSYILPFDENQDGKIDHLLVVCRDGFDDQEQSTLDRLTSLYQRGRDYEIRCIPVKFGRMAELSGPARRLYASTTPFVPTRHYRRGRGAFSAWLESELRRECDHHGIPQPARVRMIPRTTGAGRPFRWIEFRRSRKGDDSGMGYGFEIEFSEPVTGLMALGYGAHFGLGQFRAVGG